MNVLLGVTGSVASTLTLKLIELLETTGSNVVVVATKPSLYFWDVDQADTPVLIEEDEWPGEKYDKNLPVKHIELRDWADLLVIAPLTANTLAKMANGLCDNLLTSIVRAWDLKKPIVAAPAMNTKMWEHPVTSQHITLIKSWYQLEIIDPM